MADLSIYLYDEPIRLSRTLTTSATPGWLTAALLERVHVKDQVLNTQETSVVSLVEGLHVVEQLTVAPPVSGSVVITKVRASAHLMIVTLAWTSGTNGTVSGHWFAEGNGALWQVEFIPNLGATQPTNSYNAYLMDQNGADYAIGKGASLTDTAGVIAAQNGPLSILPDSLLDLQINGAGSGKTGLVILTIGRI